jgi:hypothetical protein
VRTLWATPGPRLLFSLFWVVLGLWILRAAIAAPGEAGYARRADGAFGPALFLVAGFGVQAVQAVADLVRGTNSRPVYMSAGRWMERRLGIPVSLLVIFGPSVLWVIFGR